LTHIDFGPEIVDVAIRFGMELTETEARPMFLNRAAPILDLVLPLLVSHS
jgi:hypothetical protein